MESSSFPLCLSLILCNVCAFFAIQSTSTPLTDVCTKSKNVDFCLSVLKDHSNENLHDLTQSIIILAASNATGTGAKIKLLQNQTKDPDVEAIYMLCANYYDWAISSLVSAEQYLKMDQYQNLITAANIVIEDASNCETAFDQMKPGYVSNITKENEDLQKLGDIIVAAANLF